MKLHSDAAADSTHTLSLTGTTGVDLTGLILGAQAALRSGIAGTTLPATACKANSCKFDLQPGDTTVTLAIAIGVDVVAAGAHFTLVLDGNSEGSVSVQLRLSSAVSAVDFVLAPSPGGVGAQELTAGSTRSASLRAVPAPMPPGWTLTDLGTITLPRATSGLLVAPAARARCAIDAAALHCRHAVGSLVDYGSFTLTALPNATARTTITAMVSDPTAAAGRTGRVISLVVTARAVGGPVDITGSFGATILGQATTRCDDNNKRCFYQTYGTVPRLRTLAVPGGRAVWAELTWIAPSNRQGAGQLGSTTRQLMLGSAPSRPVPVTGKVADLRNGSVAISADVTAQINAAIKSDRTITVAMPGPGHQSLTADDVTGWTLTVIWATSPIVGSQHVQTVPIVDMSSRTPGVLRLASPGPQVEQAGALLLWNPVPKLWNPVPKRHISVQGGAFCSQEVCEPRGATMIRCAEVLPRCDDGSLFIRVPEQHSTALLGPGLVVRPAQRNAG